MGGSTSRQAAPRDMGLLFLPLGDPSMGWRNATDGWGIGTRALHWLMALMLVLQWVGGQEDDWLGGVGLHVSFGLTLMVLAVLRLGVRLSAGPAPQLPPGTPAFAARLASTLHVAWYLWFIAMPLTGVIWRQARGKLVSWFGLFELPALVAEDKALAGLAHEAHEVLGWVAVGLLALHVAAALKHHFISRNNVLTGMTRGPSGAR
jgi:cytochrome b561